MIFTNKMEIPKVMMEFTDNNLKILISLLSAGIRDVCPKISCCYNITNWQVIIDFAAKHKVTALVYNSMVKSTADLNVPESIMNELRKQCLVEVVEQDRNYLAFGDLLKRLVLSEVSVIILKGLFLRELYSDPCLRSMCDYDILVKPDDFNKAEMVIEQAGYVKKIDREKHAVFFHPANQCIELHRRMVKENRHSLNEFEYKVWNSAVHVIVSGTNVLSLEPTDQAIYLILHMVSHIKSGGFGLRQLCDWVLFIEAYKKKIDWIEFVMQIKSMDMIIFTNVLFKACHQLFNLDIPQGWLFEDNKLDGVINSFIQDIFDSGVFGRDSNDRITANRMLYYTGGEEAKTHIQKIRTYASLLFPKAEKLDVRFEYVRKYRFLLPVAWLHRFAHTIVRKDIDIFEKLSVLRPKKAAEICTNRSLLLQQLGLLKK